MCVCCFFFFNDTATTEIYTLSLHDALPIYRHHGDEGGRGRSPGGQRRDPAVRLHREPRPAGAAGQHHGLRSEEHTSELQSRQYLVCRLLLEKKKIKKVSRGEVKVRALSTHE